MNAMILIGYTHISALSFCRDMDKIIFFKHTLR